MRKNIKLNNKGFSLIELMVVVAIIGILAAVGIPQYAKFQSRTRQGEAKAHLSALYAAETSFRGEWTLFTIDLANIGYAATGSSLRYTAGFNVVNCGAIYATTALVNGAPAEGGAVRSQLHLAAVNTGAPPATWAQNGAAALFIPAGVVALPGTVCLAGGVGATFTATASGDPRNNLSSQFFDQWTINDAKLLRNTVVGL